ncbi:hypothetical protein [Candidatus Skiveiella danica]|uniref:hypothetical protein n=1 Tax=Candidatus Skiveiella danica TaxID=3386177 RepID=UPI0039B85281
MPSWTWPGASVLPAGRKSIGFGNALMYWLGNLLVYGPLRNNLGMSRVRVAPHRR